MKDSIKPKILLSRKILAVIISLFLTASPFSASALTLTPLQPSVPIIQPALDPIIESLYDYKITNGQATVTKYKGSQASVTIPSKLGGAAVTALGSMSFSANKALQSVIIPEGVTRLGYNTFQSCSSLSSVTLPSTMKFIEEEAFYECTSLASITLPASLQEIGLYTFSNTALKTITIPKATTTIGGQAFYNCKNLEAIQVETGNPAYCSVDGVLYNAAKTTLFVYPSKKSGISYSVPGTVTTIENYAVQHQAYLQTLTIPASVKIISSEAFARCPDLAKVTFQGPSTVYMLGAVFGYCPSLANVTLPAGLKEISRYTFEGCKSLKNITIPNTVTAIEQWAFKDCINLAQVKLPSNLSIIGSCAFRSTSLQSLELPGTVTEIQGGAFSDCKNLTSVTFPASIAKINIRAFSDCINLKDVRFRGNGPKLGEKVFFNAASGFKVYYPSSAENWTTPTWYGYPSQPYADISVLPLIPQRLALFTPVTKDTGILIDPRNMTLPELPFDFEDTTVTDPPELILPLLPAVPLPGSIPSPQPLPGTTPSDGSTEIRLYLGRTGYLVGGQQQTMDVSPILADGRLLLPVKYIAAPLGAVTDWDPVEQKVTISLQGNVIMLWINKPMARVNGVEKQIDPNNSNVKPIVVPPGRTMLPLRFIGESLGCEVNWDQGLQEAKLTYLPSTN